MRSISTAVAGAGLLLLAACGGSADDTAAVNNSADTTVLDDEGVLEPVNAADAADVTPAEANAVDNAVDAALPQEPLQVSNESLNGQ